MWPSATVVKDETNNCYEIKKDTTHWSDVFTAYKSSIESELGVSNITEDDISSIILKPYKFSMNNAPDGSYHVDCKIEVKCEKTVTATFYVQDASQNQDRYYQVESKNYKTNDIVEFPKYTDKDGYDFSGWYLDGGLNNAVSKDNYKITENVDFYAKYTPKTYTVTFNAGENGKLDRNQDTVTKTGESGTSLSAPTPKANDGFEFAGWVEGSNTTTVEIPATITKDVTYTATWREKTYTVIFNAGDNGKLDQNQDTVTRTGKSGATLTAPATNANAGYEFAGWVEGSNTTTVEIPTTITENATYTATWKPAEVPPTTAKYTVKHHKWDVAQNKYIEDTSKAQSYDGTIGAEVNVTEKATSYEGYVLNKQVSELKGTVAPDNKLTLNLYYDIDKIGETTKENPNGGSDDIPDRYQVTINYVTDNTGRGQITGLTKEVKTIYENGTDGKWASTGKVTASGSTAEATGSRNYFSNWANDAGLPTSSTAKLGQQTFNAAGGKTYTFTANFDRSSGGSGGSSRPTVTIPDDVPTGLNGKDHYAYIIGYGNNDVRPQNNITRAEVATIFFRLLTDETREANMTKSNGYNDVKDGDWFCCAVSTLSKMGIIKGYEDGSFKPNDPISRAEFAAIAARFDPDGDKTPATFADVTSHWAKDEISIAANHGWIKGYEDGSFKPDQKITRAETMTLVNRVLKRLPETKDDLHKDMKTWPDNQNESAWFYLAVQEATNSHYQNLKKDGTHEKWESMRETRDWAALEK